MNYQCIDLLDSQLLTGVKVLAGKKHLINQIRWVHCSDISETPDVVPQNVKSGDLMIVRGPILKEDPLAILEKLMQIAIEKQLSGMLVFRSKYMEEIPPQLIKLCKGADLPLLFIENNLPPISDLVCEITYGIMSSDSNTMREKNLLYDIISNDIRDPNAFLARARFHKFNLSVPHQAVCIHHLKSTSRAKKKADDAEPMVLIEKTCEEVLLHYYERVLMVPFLDSYVCLIPENTYHVPVEKLAHQILVQLNKVSSQFDVVIGIGNVYDTTDGFYRSVIEAQQQTHILRKMEISNVVKTAHQMQVQLFVMEHLEEPSMRNIHNACIAPLMESDQTGGNELLNTLDVFMNCDKNISVTANMLFIHRNTLRTRLAKIEQLTGKQFDNVHDCFDLQMALYIHKLMS